MPRAIIIFIIVIFFSLATWADALVVIGKIPGRYLSGIDSDETRVGAIFMEDRIIKDIKLVNELEPTDTRSVPEKVNALRTKGLSVVVAKTGRRFDVLYPGLIDLHKHNKQNMLPTWGSEHEEPTVPTGAKGQFANRHEWRDTNEYSRVQGNNMNPWSSNKGAQIATYRWSELQAMVLGTAYLQGHIINHKDFAIHSVEDGHAFITERPAVDSPGDIIDPEKWVYLWTDIRPVINELGCLGQDKCYGRAVSLHLKSVCPDIPESVTDNVYTDESVNWLLANVQSAECANLPEDKKEIFVDYFGDTFGNHPHKNAIRRYQKLTAESRSAIITHLAEGRRNDPVNWTEFQLLRLAGLDLPGMNLIHGVGLGVSELVRMAERQMGLIWSPYSNFILYGETVDIEAAFKAGVNIALGSDWTPTGSKGVLDELKLARRYLKKINLHPRLIDDEDLYNMVTENPARMINHYGFENEKERGIGTLQVGAMASLVAVKERSPNPYRNLVKYAEAQDINLLVIDGKLIYGNESFIGQASRPNKMIEYEQISGKVFAATLNEQPELFPYKPDGGAATDTEILLKAKAIELSDSKACGFSEPKVMVYHGPSHDYDKEGRVKDLLEVTGVNLDQYDGILRYLGVALLSQSHNVIHTPEQTEINESAVRVFPPLYGCDDKVYLSRLYNMARPWGRDELDRNAENRLTRREHQGLYSVPQENHLALPHQWARLFALPVSELWMQVPFVRESTENGIDYFYKDVIIEMEIDRTTPKFKSLLK